VGAHLTIAVDGDRCEADGAAAPLVGLLLHDHAARQPGDVKGGAAGAQHRYGAATLALLGGDHEILAKINFMFSEN
jgi:hypothetical protein